MEIFIQKLSKKFIDSDSMIQYKKGIYLPQNIHFNNQHKSIEHFDAWTRSINLR